MRILALAAALAPATACQFDASGVSGGEVAAPDARPGGGGVDAAIARDAPGRIDARPDGRDAGGDEEFPPGDARLVVAAQGQAALRSARFDAERGAFVVEDSLPEAAGPVLWVENRVRPDGLEIVAAVSSGDDPELMIAERRPGSSFSVAWRADIETATTRAFDLAVEASGEVVVAYPEDDGALVVRTRAGGSWGDAAPVPTPGGGGGGDGEAPAILWVELEARPGGYEIALGAVDDDERLGVAVWDGESWSEAEVVEAQVQANPGSGDARNRPFDLAYAGAGGDLLAVWGRDDDLDGFYATRGRSGSFSNRAALGDALRGTPDFTDLAAEPGGDRVAACLGDLGGDGLVRPERLGAGTFVGDAWANVTEADESLRNLNDAALGDFPVSVAWVGQTGEAVCVYPDDETGTLDWASWTAAGGWATQGDVDIGGKSFTESAQLVTLPGRDEVLAVFTDSEGVLRAARYDGAWELLPLGGGLSELTVAIASKPLSVAARP